MFSDPWFSEPGWYTIVMGPTGLTYVKISKEESKIVRDVGGILFDKEGFANEILGRIKEPYRFTPYKRLRIYLPPRICECQYTGWKSHE